VEKNGVMNAVVRDLQTLFDTGVMGALSDKQLLDRFVEQRDGTIFEAIIRRHGPTVWGVCRRVLRDHHDAEDAFQATFLVLARKSASIMPREKLGNWLYGVAYRTAMKARTQRRKRRDREAQVSEMPEPMAAADDRRDKLAESLDRELNRLPEKYRSSIVLCDLQGRSHKEAASQLGWPIGTVSSRLSRARSLLAKRLARRGVSLSAGSLAVLLSQESASAGMPTWLIGPTAQAASTFAAAEAVTATAGMVSAEVVTLTGEVLKVMLLGKLKIGVVVLLVASAVAAGGTGLAFQATTTEPGQREDLQRLIDEKKEDLQRLIDEQKRDGQPKKGQVQGIAAPGPTASNLSIDELRRQKEYIDAMITVEEARSKTPREIEEMIQAKTKDLERLRWAVRVVEAQVARLKKIRDAPRTEEKTPFRTHGGVAK
jgi:RNA polymerase sigma factor (sigma-70 family)